MAINANITLRRLVYELKEWADAHEMIDRFGYGDFLDLYNNSANSYPYLMVNSVSGGEDESYIKFTLEVCIMDWVFDNKGVPDNENQNRVESDLIEILRDLTSTIRRSDRWQSFCKLNNVNNPTRKFVEKGGDKVTGWCITLDLWLKRKSGFCQLENLLPTYDFETQTGQPVTCSPATYSNSDGSFTQSIASGGSYTAPDVTITINGSPNTLPANKDASYTVTGSPAGNTMNGTSLTDIVSGTTKNFTIRYEDDSPVVVTTISDSATEFIGEVPNSPTILPTGGIYKSGADTSYFSGDEGDDPPGYGTNWFVLGFNNPFGHGFRISGTSGGYTDGTSYFDVNGNATTKALAFPNDIALYWDKYNQSTDTVFAVCFNALPADSVNDHLASQPYTLDSKNDWKIITLDELNVLSKTDTNANAWLDYLPIERPYTGTTDRLWTRTPAEITNYYHFWTGAFTTRTIFTVTYETFITRLYTLTELGL